MNGGEVNPATRSPPQTAHRKEPERGKDGRKPFTDQDRVELIAAVREYPFLYNTKDKWFDENLKRQMAWREISTIVGHSAEACEEVWRSLLSSFKKYRHRKKSGQALRRWKFDGDMEFFTPFINARKSAHISSYCCADMPLLSKRFGAIDLNESTGYITRETGEIPDCNVVECDEKCLPVKEDKPEINDIEGVLVTGRNMEGSLEVEKETGLPRANEEELPTAEDKILSEDSTGSLEDSMEAVKQLERDISLPDPVSPKIDKEIQESELELQEVGGKGLLDKATMTESTPKDEFDHFFVDMAARVRKFSKLKKALAKSKVFAVISEIETSDIQSMDSNSCS